MLNGNIFREAQQLLRDKNMLEMNGEELITVKAALIPVNIFPQFNDKPIDEGLEELAQMFDEASQTLQGNRQNKASQASLGNR